MKTNRSSIRPTERQVAARAYQLYLESGCQHGHDMDHWLQAEYELLHLPVRVLAILPPPKVAGLKSVAAMVRAAMF